MVSNAVDPGVVSTNFARNNGLLAWAKHTISHGIRGELVSAARAADTIVYLATSVEIAGVTGSIVPGPADNRTIPSSPESRCSRRLCGPKRRLNGARCPEPNCLRPRRPMISAAYLRTHSSIPCEYRQHSQPARKDLREVPYREREADETGADRILCDRAGGMRERS